MTERVFARRVSSSNLLFRCSRHDARYEVNVQMLFRVLLLEPPALHTLYVGVPERRVGLASSRHTTRQVVRGRRSAGTSSSRRCRARGRGSFGRWCRARAHRGTGLSSGISSRRRCRARGRRSTRISGSIASRRWRRARTRCSSVCLSVADVEISLRRPSSIGDAPEGHQ
jgi:hypothetical protein